MTETSTKTPWLRLLALFAVFAVIVAACTPGGSSSDEASAEPGASEEPGESVAASAGAGGPLDPYTLGIFQDVTTDNQWNSIDTQGNTVWNSYFLNPMLAQPYTVSMPGIEFVPQLADAELAPATQEGDVWIGEFTFREGLVWSDGEAITADDYVFTWNTAVDLALIGGWQDYTDANTEELPNVVEGAEAVDAPPVRATFTAPPGLAQWGPATNGSPMERKRDD
jgi:ABC-type transport system substrate-binding protein